MLDMEKNMRLLDEVNDDMRLIMKGVLDGTVKAKPGAVAVHAGHVIVQGVKAQVQLVIAASDYPAAIGKARDVEVDIPRLAS